VNRLSVVVLAGAGDGDSALMPEQKTHKALIPLHGRPLIDYVLHALAGLGMDVEVVIVGFLSSALPCTPVPCQFVADHGGILENVLAGLAAAGSREHVLISSCDLPFLTSEAISDFMERAAETGADLCYPVVREQAIESRFPGDCRSYRKLADGSFAGGDLLWLRPSIVQRNAGFAQDLTSNRKSAWGLAKVMGSSTVIRFLTGRLRVADLEKRASKLLGCTVAAVESVHPEIAMDIDKPHQLQLAERMLPMDQ